MENIFKIIRLSNNMQVSEFAFKSGLSSTTIQQLENDCFDGLDMVEIIKIYSYFSHLTRNAIISLSVNSKGLLKKAYNKFILKVLSRYAKN